MGHVICSARIYNPWFDKVSSETFNPMEIGNLHQWAGT